MSCVSKTWKKNVEYGSYFLGMSNNSFGCRDTSNKTIQSFILSMHVLHRSPVVFGGLIWGGNPCNYPGIWAAAWDTHSVHDLTQLKCSAGVNTIHLCVRLFFAGFCKRILPYFWVHWSTPGSPSSTGSAVLLSSLIDPQGPRPVLVDKSFQK